MHFRAKTEDMDFPLWTTVDMSSLLPRASSLIVVANTAFRKTQNSQNTFLVLKVTNLWRKPFTHHFTLNLYPYTLLHCPGSDFFRTKVDTVVSKYPWLPLWIPLPISKSLASFCHSSGLRVHGEQAHVWPVWLPDHKYTQHL